MSDTSTKPYLLRALHEWCVDNGHTPYIAVLVDARTQVPADYVKAGEIVLNVSPVATHQLVIGNEWIEFQARFGGTARSLVVPVDRVMSIYARENGHGMAFEVSPAAPVSDETLSSSTPEAGRPRLTAIRNDLTAASSTENRPRPALASVESEASSAAADASSAESTSSTEEPPPDDPAPSTPGGSKGSSAEPKSRPRLTVIK